MKRVLVTTESYHFDDYDIVFNDSEEMMEWWEDELYED